MLLSGCFILLLTATAFAAVDADTVDGKHASDLANSVHTHTQSQVTGLEAALAGKADATHQHDGLYAPVVHDHDTAYVKKTATVVIVAPTGGDFSSIQAAVDSINPTPDTPYLIKVLPGVYSGNVSITNKGNFHIEGAGQDVVKILGGMTVSSGTNFTVSGIGIYQGVAGASALYVANSDTFTVRNNGLVGSARAGSTDWVTGVNIANSSSGTIADNHISYFMDGIYVAGSTVTIRNNTIKGDNSYFNLGRGMYVDSGTCTISNNSVSNVVQWGIMLQPAANAVVSGNSVQSAGYGIYLTGPATAKNNVVTGSTIGIMCDGASTAGSKVSGNTIDGSRYGIYILNGSAPIINFNMITGSNSADINVAADSRPVILSNTYNTLMGTTAVGRFNADLNGNVVAP